MTNVNECMNVMSPKEMVEDFLISQKHLTASYNTYAGECADPCLRGAMLNILADEHNIQADLFSDMMNNGWYQTTPAEQQKIEQMKQEYPQQCCWNG